MLIALAVFYFQGARIMSWIKQQPFMTRILETVREHLRPADEKAGPPLTPLTNGAGATGGETTFASGQGFGTMSPDDGSDSFRVVVPRGN